MVVCNLSLMVLMVGMVGVPVVYGRWLDAGRWLAQFPPFSPQSSFPPFPPHPQAESSRVRILMLPVNRIILLRAMHPLNRMRPRPSQIPNLIF